MAANFGRRFDELCQGADEIESKKKMETHLGISGYEIDSNALLNWRVKARHLIVSVCGDSSQHFLQFIQSEQPSVYVTNYEILQKIRAVFLAAKDDYEGGYLNKIKDLIQADVFDSELEQASELLAAGYYTAAAVIAGVVLETTLRQMCEDNGLGVGKLDKMNADLAKAGAFSKLVQKQITTWADIRNSAAHGRTDQFGKDDVSAMIRDVRKFVTDRLS